LGEEDLKKLLMKSKFFKGKGKKGKPKPKAKKKSYINTIKFKSPKKKERKVKTEKNLPTF